MFIFRRSTFGVAFTGTRQPVKVVSPHAAYSPLCLFTPQTVLLKRGLQNAQCLKQNDTDIDSRERESSANDTEIALALSRLPAPPHCPTPQHLILPPPGLHRKK